jgi:hypothetical protein
MALFNNSSGPFNGILPPAYVSGVGASYPPHWALYHTGTLNTTATRLYYIPFYFNSLTAFTGLRSYNSGAGDNGEVFRMGVYEAALTSSGGRGLPGTRLVDCGEVTLTGASAVRTLASSFTPTYVGWHWLAYHANSAAAMYAVVNANQAGSPAYIGTSFSLPVSAALGSQFGGLYVDTAYGALAASAVAPTGVDFSAPLVAPYIT